MQQSLRIAMFVGSFPTVSETFILRQIAGLLDMGHQVDIYADTRQEGTPFHPEIEKYQLLSRTTYVDGPRESITWDMPVWPLWGRTWLPGSATSIHNFTRFTNALPRLARSFARTPRLAVRTLQKREYSYRAASLSVLYRLATLVGENKRYDVLHAHFGPVGNAFRFARDLWKAPLVVSFHGYDFCTLPRREGRNMYQKLFVDVDAVTVNSEFTRQEVEKLGCPSSKLQKLPVGLDPEEFKFHERSLGAGETVRLLTVARLVEIKGVEFVIRAIGELRAKHPNIRYDVIGDGPIRSNLQGLICDLGLQSIVTLHGAKAGLEVQRHMQSAHLFILTSVNVEGDQEGQGLVLQEAQACGLPVVCTEHGAFPEGILPGRSGLLVPERNPHAVAEALEDLINHPERWPAMGRSGREFVREKYNIRELNRQLVEIYEDTIAQFHATK